MSRIEWTDKSWNCVRARRRDTGKVGTHCVKVSRGCANCYAESHNRRMLPHGGTGLKYTAGNTDKVDIFIDEKALRKPLHWCEPRDVFVCSMTDLFGEFVSDEQIDRVFAMMALCPQHRFQVLTKRPERAAAYLNGIEHYNGDLGGADGGDRLSAAAGCLLDGGWIHGKGKRYRRRIERFITDGIGETCEDDEYEPRPIKWPLPNVLIGTSVEDQQALIKRLAWLMKCPAAVRFVSAEPLLGPIELPPDNLRGYSVHPMHAPECDDFGCSPDCPVPDYEHAPSIDWVIVGGESGAGAKPCAVDWIDDIIDDCVEADAPVFVKQLGSFPVALDETFCDDWPGQGGQDGRTEFDFDVPDPWHCRYRLKHSKGGDPSEWPERLRRREQPKEARDVCAV